MGKALKEMRDKKATEDVDVPGIYEHCWGKLVSDKRHNRSTIYTKLERRQDFVEATMTALKKKSEAKNAATDVHTQLR